MDRRSLASSRSPWAIALTVILVVGLWWFTGSEDDPGTPAGTGTPVASGQPTPGTQAESTRTPSGTISSATESPDASATSATSKPTPKPPTRSASPKPSPTRGDTSPRAPTSSGVDEHGLRWVAAADLPDPAQEILAAIDAGGPFEYAPKDGSTFGNFEGVLPQRKRGYYREYTVATPGVSHRGARRIVTGSGGEFYWTADHYESFSRIRR